jgi:hypothetical protein
MFDLGFDAGLSKHVAHIHLTAECVADARPSILDITTRRALNK